MKIIFTCGQVRAECRAGRNHSQWLADIMVNGAARPYTLIARTVFDPESGFGSKRGRTRSGWHFAQVIRGRRVIALVYRPNTGLPVSPTMLGAPAYAWWPQLRRSQGIL